MAIDWSEWLSIKPPFLSQKRAITTFLSRKHAITTFLSRKFMITRSSIAFEDFLGSSIAPQVMPPCLQVRYGDDDGDNLVDGYVVAHLKRDIVQLGEKVRRILFLKCICFYWFLVFLKFWIFGILNTYFSTTISVITDLVLLSFELRILNFGFFKSYSDVPLLIGSRRQRMLWGREGWGG